MQKPPIRLSRARAYVIPVVEDGHLILVSDHATYVDTHGEHLFFIFGSDVDENILDLGHQLGVLSVAGVNGRPAENAFDNAFGRMDVHFLGRSDHVVGSPVADDVDKAVIRDVVNEPGDLVGVAFDDDLVILSRVDDPVDGAVIVEAPVVDIWFDIFQPKLLAGGLEPGRGGIIEIFPEEFLRLCCDHRHFFGFFQASGLNLTAKDKKLFRKPVTP
jgi:hypothetical protein